MATLAITAAINTNAGAIFRRLAHQIELASRDIPDNNSSGASYVLTIDNAPGAGIASVQVTAGPTTSALFPV